MASQYTCNVIAAGPSATPDVVCIRLKDIGGAFDDRWFDAYEPKAKEMLATALAAMASGFRVWVELEAAEEYGRINYLYATKSA